MSNFSDCKEDGANWITLATGEFYPDILVDATPTTAWVMIVGILSPR